MNGLISFLNFLKLVAFTTFSQLAWLLGFLFIFGFILYVFARLTRITYAKTTGTTLDIIITGWIGTPIHELGHAILCVVFRHKIVDLKLYNPNPDDGTLGYVNHSYDPKSIYQKIGNFFIGIGPVIFGTIVIFIALNYLVPNTKEVFSSIQSQGSILVKNLHGDWSSFASIWDSAFNTLKALLGKNNFSHYTFWIFLYLSICISSHMELSPSDIKGAISGLFILVLFFLGVNLLILGIETANANHYFGNIWHYIKLESYTSSINSFIGISGTLFFFASIVSGLNFLLTYSLLSLYSLIKGEGLVNPLW